MLRNTNCKQRLNTVMGTFVRIGGRQNEFNVFRRLFQSLQHGIERAFWKAYALRQ